MAGEEGYLLPRDQGPIRRYVRDVVDSRRNLLGLFMPSTLFLDVRHVRRPAAAAVGVAGDAGADGRDERRRPDPGPQSQQLVDAKFPNNTESRWKLGLYAAGRASQMRRMRAPRPQVKHGASVD